MDNFHDDLLALQASLEKLQVVLAEEHKQLSALKIHPIALQTVSDHKSRLLATIAWHDEQRKVHEKRTGTQAPYAQQSQLAELWQPIIALVKRCKEMNLLSGELLERHRQNAARFRGAIARAGVGGTLYGAKGQNEGPATGQAYNITI